MSQMPPPPPPPPARPATRSSALSGPGLPRTVTAVGVALLMTAVVLSTSYTRDRGDIDWSNYVMGLLATLALLVVGAGTFVRCGREARQVDRATDLVAWPSAFGVVAVGLMVGVAMDDGDATPYVVGLLVLALSVGGYVLTRRDPFVVTAIVGFALFYAKVCLDLFDLGDGGDNVAMGISAALLVFTVLVTAAGWALPSRALSGVLAGIVAVVGNVATLAGIVVVASLQSVFSSFSLDEPAAAPRRFDAYDNDVWVILLLALLLVVGWCACAIVSGHVGFRLLVVAMSVSVVPAATIALAVAHPTWWEVVVGAVGGLVLLASLGRGLPRRMTSR